MHVVRKNTPWVFPIREEDGRYPEKCQFGVKINLDLETPEVCGCCGNYPCTCGESSDLDIAGVGSLTCRSCHWCISDLDDQIVCSHPIKMDASDE